LFSPVSGPGAGGHGGPKETLSALPLAVNAKLNFQLIGKTLGFADHYGEPARIFCITPERTSSLH